MRVQSMPAKSADSCAATIRITPARPFEAAPSEPLPIHHKAATVPDDNLQSIRALCTVTATPLIESWPSVSFAKSAKPSAPFLKSTGWVAT